MDFANQIRRQIGALPLVVDADGGTDVCLVTTRGGDRWIIPKGNPIDGVAAHDVARREALEEAGLVGEIGRHPIGSFDFSRRRAGQSQLCAVDVYPLYVAQRLSNWAEARQRRVIRCKPGLAATLVAIPGLAALIREFANACAP